MVTSADQHRRQPPAGRHGRRSARRPARSSRRTTTPRSRWRQRDADGSSRWVAPPSPRARPSSATSPPRAETLTTSVPSPARATSRRPTRPRARWALSGSRTRPLNGDTITLAEGGSARALPGARGRHAPTSWPASRCRSPAPAPSFAVGDATRSTTELTLRDLTTARHGVRRSPAPGLGRRGDACDLGHASPPSTATLHALPGIDPDLVGAAAAGRGRGSTCPALADDDRAELADQVTADVADHRRLRRPTPTSAASGLYRHRAAPRRSPARWAPTTRRTGAQRSSPRRCSQWTELDGCAERDAFCFVLRPRLAGGGRTDAGLRVREFNDHHFHYGYFLYAAGVLAAARPVRGRRAPAGDDLLAADIAGGVGHRPHPAAARPFDVYASHSWASGTGRVRRRQQPGVLLRGRHRVGRASASGRDAAGDADLDRQAAWLLAREAARRHGVLDRLRHDDPVYDGFDHGVDRASTGAASATTRPGSPPSPRRSSASS